MEETAAFKKRPLKELYEIVLKEFLKFERKGICSVVFRLLNSDKISKSETERILEDLEKNRPPKIEGDIYWFYTPNERIEFLEGLIKKTE